MKRRHLIHSAIICSSDIWRHLIRVRVLATVEPDVAFGPRVHLGKMNSDLFFIKFKCWCLSPWRFSVAVFFAVQDYVIRFQKRLPEWCVPTNTHTPQKDDITFPMVISRTCIAALLLPRRAGPVNAVEPNRGR